MAGTVELVKTDVSSAAEVAIIAVRASAGPVLLVGAAGLAVVRVVMVVNVVTLVVVATGVADVVGVVLVAVDVAVVVAVVVSVTVRVVVCDAESVVVAVVVAVVLGVDVAVVVPVVVTDVEGYWTSTRKPGDMTEPAGFVARTRKSFTPSICSVACSSSPGDVWLPRGTLFICSHANKRAWQSNLSALVFARGAVDAQEVKSTTTPR